MDLKSFLSAEDEKEIVEGSRKVLEFTESLFMESPEGDTISSTEIIKAAIAIDLANTTMKQYMKEDVFPAIMEELGLEKIPQAETSDE